MLKDVVSVTPLDGYRLHLRFEDGAVGEVDVAGLIAFRGVFAPLREKAVFDQVRVDAELGTVVWPGGGLVPGLPDPLRYSNCSKYPVTPRVLAWAGPRTFR